MEFVGWLQAKSKVLERAGVVIELEVNSDIQPSVRLRAERDSSLAELTVWDDGTAHMAVVNLQSGDFVFEQDGMSLANNSWEIKLEGFFSYLTSDVAKP